MNGNGCAGSMASGVSTGKMWSQEIVLQPGRARPWSIVVAVDQDDALLRQAPARSSRQRALLLGRQARPPRAMRSSCSLRRQAVRAARGDAGAHLALEAGDAHHEELVEVVGRDRQEAQPLQQRVVGVLASSSTRRLKWSQDSSRLMKRSGCSARSAPASGFVFSGFALSGLLVSLGSGLEPSDLAASSALATVRPVLSQACRPRLCRLGFGGLRLHGCQAWPAVARRQARRGHERERLWP